MSYQRFRKENRGHHVRVFSDNRVTVAYINHQGGTRSKSLMYVADRPFQLAEQHLLSLMALHIRGAENTMADFLSRNTLRQGEQSLNGSIFNLIVERWGQPEVELFATKENRKVTQFCSLNPRENPLSVDALLIDWNLRLAYAFSPLSLLPLVVRKIRKDKATVIPWERKLALAMERSRERPVERKRRRRVSIAGLPTGLRKMGCSVYINEKETRE
ncbi:unnamed protein product [Ranitomeya imitator]|uniref:Uncharacterized protein n=1 Tax=Ranitomeya imitator TaxID=111125 RepID=A0ABN9L6E3_9NEOB|nr:unnamed protein product [Ranitomeya imitator]